MSDKIILNGKGDIVSLPEVGGVGDPGRLRQDILAIIEDEQCLYHSFTCDCQQDRPGIAGAIAELVLAALAAQAETLQQLQKENTELRQSDDVAVQSEIVMSGGAGDRPAWAATQAVKPNAGERPAPDSQADDELTASVRAAIGARGPFRPFVTHIHGLNMTLALVRDCSVFEEAQNQYGVALLRANHEAGEPIVGMHFYGRLAGLSDVEQAETLAALEAALQRIEDWSDCQCEHDTEDCCALVADQHFHCPGCIAAHALAPLRASRPAPQETK